VLPNFKNTNQSIVTLQVLQPCLVSLVQKSGGNKNFF
jgi:hypothetical protein